MSTVEYTIVFSKNVAQTLEQIAIKSGRNEAEVLRRALAIYDYLNKEISKSRKIYIRDHKKKTEKELVLT